MPVWGSLEAGIVYLPKNSAVLFGQAVKSDKIVQKNANEFKKKMAGAGMIHTSDRTGGNAESGAGSASAAAGFFPIRQGIQKIRL